MQPTAKSPIRNPVSSLCLPDLVRYRDGYPYKSPICHALPLVIELISGASAAMILELEQQRLAEERAKKEAAQKAAGGGAPSAGASPAVVVASAATAAPAAAAAPSQEALAEAKSLLGVGKIRYQFRCLGVDAQ